MWSGGKWASAKTRKTQYRRYTQSSDTRPSSIWGPLPLYSSKQFQQQIWDRLALSCLSLHTKVCRKKFILKWNTVSRASLLFSGQCACHRHNTKVCLQSIACFDKRIIFLSWPCAIEIPVTACKRAQINYAKVSGQGLTLIVAYV